MYISSAIIAIPNAQIFICLLSVSIILSNPNAKRIRHIWQAGGKWKFAGWKKINNHLFFWITALTMEEYNIVNLD